MASLAAFTDHRQGRAIMADWEWPSILPIAEITSGVTLV
jgi:hypothetical protein